MNKMDQKEISIELLKKVFNNNLDEKFIFDSENLREFSYCEFFNLIINFKKKLVRLGIKKQDTICILLPNCLELVVLYFASLFLNLKIVPIDTEKGNFEIGEIISNLDYRIIITNNMNYDFEKMISIDEFPIQYKNENIDLNEFYNIEPDSVFLITFTSGSTGIPKGVMHSFNNLVKSALAFNQVFSFGATNIFYHNLPMTYMAGILNLIILPIISGSKIVLGKRFNISCIGEFWKIPIKYSVNTFWFVPTIIEILIKLDRDPSGLEYCKGNKIIGCVGTASLNSFSKIFFEQKYSCHLYESYGLSETLFVTSNYPNEDEPETIGKILDGVEIKFLRDDEIKIKVPWMFLGYYNKKIKVSKTEWFSSGDICSINKNGRYVVTGRKKDMIVRGGANISPKKIENFIKNNFKVETVVLGFPEKLMGEKIVCFYKIGSKFDQKHINKEIIIELGKSHHIDQFFVIPDIPKNLNGKIDKPKIREIYNSKNYDFRY